MQTPRFGDEIGYKAEMLIQKRAQYNLKDKFEEARKTIKTATTLIKKARSNYDLYLFYYNALGVTDKNESLALEYLRKASESGYPVATVELARHYLKENNHHEAKNCIQTCDKIFNKAFLESDRCEQKKLKEAYGDMQRLLRLIESEIEEKENLSDDSSVGEKEFREEEQNRSKTSRSMSKNRFTLS